MSPMAIRAAIYQEPVAAGGVAYKFRLTIESDYVSADATSFELLVTEANLPAGFWSHVESDGRSIQAWNVSESAQLDHDLIAIDTTGETIILRIGVPSISASVDVSIWIYYGDTGASDESTTDTYKSANIGYYELEAYDELGDQSAGNHDMTAYNMDSGNEVTGHIGGGLEFNGTDEYVAAVNTVTDYPFTVMGWFYDDGTTNDWYSCGGLGTSSGAPDYAIVCIYGTGPLLYIKNGSPYDLLDGTTTGNSAGWYFLAGTFSNTGSRELFQDGASEGTSTSNIQFPDNIDRATAGIRMAGDSYVYEPGRSDSLRIYEADIANTEIATIYNNESSPSTFYFCGAEEAA